MAVKKILLGIIAVLVLVVGGGLAWAVNMKPKMRPASTDTVERTPERIERGRYLVENVINCFDCHSEYDSTRWGLPIKEGRKGTGGLCFDKENAGFPGRVCAQNITQDPETGIGAWTDGEIMRAIREGVSRDGRGLVPMMPYPYMKILSDEDVKSIVVYLRTIPPVKQETEPVRVDFPVSIFMKMEPKPLDGPVPEPNRANTVEYGKYLATLACYECHTPVDSTMHNIHDKAFSGGREFDFDGIIPGMRQRTANITPHDTGIGPKSRENFIAQFKSFADTATYTVPAPGDQNTIMPWLDLAGMTEEDLGAIYDYLQTVPPIEHVVERRMGPKTAAAK